MKDLLLSEREKLKKFCHWSGESGYYPPRRIFQNHYQTELRSTATDIDEIEGNKEFKDFLLKSVQISSWQRERNRSQVVRKQVVSDTQSSSEGVSLPSLTKTTVFLNNYADISDWVNRLKSIEEETWSSAFSHYSYKDPSNQKGLVKESSEATVLAKDIERVVQQVLGLTTPSLVIDKFTLLAQQSCSERIITWENFKLIIAHVVSLLESEQSKRSETPALVKLMKEPSIIDKDMGPLREISTVYQDSTCAPILALKKKSAAFSRTFPFTSADLFLSTIPMDPTTTELSAGTTKGTFHVPGYTGHIPRNKRNDRKVAHSFALHPRPNYNNLLLSNHRGGCISGYTGYVSFNIPPFKERLTAMDPMTSNGAAYGPDRRIL